MPRNPRNIGAGTNYRMGMMGTDGTPEYADLINTESFSGSKAIATAKASGKKIVTWDDFFRENPLRIPISGKPKMWYVYEVSDNGANGQYVVEGKFVPIQVVNNGLGDNMQPSNRAAMNQARTELEISQQKVIELQGKVAEQEAEIYRLKNEQEKWYKDEKIPLETKIVGLEYQIKAMEKDKETTIQGLNDDYERRNQLDREKLEKEEMKRQIQDLRDIQEKKTSSLSGMFTEAAPFAVPLLAEALSKGFELLNNKYPNLIGGFVNKTGGNLEPSPEHAAELAQKQQSNQLDPKTAFKQNA